GSARNGGRHRVVAGVVVGLVVGKAVGITGSAWLAVRLGLCSLPTGVGWSQLVGAAPLAVKLAILAGWRARPSWWGVSGAGPTGGFQPGDTPRQTGDDLALSESPDLDGRQKEGPTSWPPQ
ncbi:MAG: Na+/H+ antiporter NhaA, partial [Acidimicrobiales bacterium]